MSCDKYKDRIALIAMGEATDAERAAFEEHTAACADCRAEYERLREIVAMLTSAPGDAPTEIETLQMENEILRRLAVDSLRADTQRRNRSAMRMMIRVAAAIVLFACGYLAQPALKRLYEPAAPSARAVQPPITGAQIRLAMKSGYRFSGEGLAVIAHGTDALKDARELPGRR